MTRFLLLISLLAASATSVAQDQLKVGDVLDLEERVMVKKMTDELSKANPNAAPAAPVFVPPRAPKIVYPTETLAIYGTTATSLEAQLSMGGRTYTVRNGSPVQDYVVSSINPAGIELTKVAPAPKGRKKHCGAAPKKVTLFAPLSSR